LDISSPLPQQEPADAAVLLLLLSLQNTAACLLAAAVFSFLKFLTSYTEKRLHMNIDISKIWPGWTSTELFDHGTFGHVYKATYAETDTVAAVKVISYPHQ